MNISQFSKQVGLSAHTLRYYEKIGLLTNIVRDKSGHRCYNSKEVDWVAFINRLKNTGMPLKYIIHYAVLREKGDSTYHERQTILKDHAITLAEKISKDKAHLQALNTKIAFYEEHK